MNNLVHDVEFYARLDRIRARDDKARAFLELVAKDLPANLEGVVMVNADTHECFHAKDKEEGWQKARLLYGSNIAHPPMWMIRLTPEAPLPPPPL